jgi:hypothetical protein
VPMLSFISKTSKGTNTLCLNECGMCEAYSTFLLKAKIKAGLFQPIDRSPKDLHARSTKFPKIVLFSLNDMPALHWT